MDDFFHLKKMFFLAILGPPYRGIGATIRIGRGIFKDWDEKDHKLT